MSSTKRLRRKSINYSDPGKVLDLVIDLNDDANVLLQVKINKYLQEECEAETVFLVVVHEASMEAFIEAVGDNALPKMNKIYLPQKLQEVIKTGQEQIEIFANFPHDIQSVITPFLSSNRETKKERVLLFPVLDNPFSVIVCVLGPKIPEEHVAVIVRETFLFCWSVIKKTIALEYECALKTKCQHLLRVARRLFTQVASLETLLKIAMDQAKQLIKAEYCSVRLIDMDHMDLVERYHPEVNRGKTDEESERVERHFPMNKGITGQVITKGTLINCKSAKEHPNFQADVDCYPGLDCKAILCFPIRDQSGIIGVGQLINKIGEPYFDSMDEEMAVAFSIYCGICIMHSFVYEKIHEAHIRNILANELIMYHMQVSDQEVAKLLECTGFHSHPHFSSLHFNNRALPLKELPCYAFKMFVDLGFDKKFNIKRDKLARFILYVKKSYRDVPYHSWVHGFTVAHWAYAAITNYKLISEGYFTDLQGLMYVVAGLVHDLDHRGTTNSFQIHGQTTLAALYSSEGSVMERHHLAQAMCVLNTEGCDILEGLPRRDYDRAILMLRDYILATDLSNYFKNMNEYKTISYDFQKGNRLHTTSLQCLLMNAADLSDQLKDWQSVKKTAAAVLTEFFNQGDEEKSRGELPMMFMDREKCFIPELQIQFLTMTCIPLFETLGRIIPKVSQCLKVVENHIERWDAAKPIFSEVPTVAGLSVLLSPELDTLIEKNLIEKERQRSEAQLAE